MSRYERSRRTPLLETALAYEAIFGVPVRDLYMGTFHRVEENIRRRARLLLAEVRKEGDKRNPSIAFLERLAQDGEQRA